MLYNTLLKRAEQITSLSMLDPPPKDQWKHRQPRLRKQWLGMLGLDPLPQKTPMHVTVTGTVRKHDFAVEKLHFQPIPGCHIAANLYRPLAIPGPLPAVLYVCGHSPRGKFHYQEHPRWFARHGYIALILDAIQIGENTGFHHGTYAKECWHWYSQGYSPVAVEVWTAMRAADYLISRDDVNPEKIGITGNSGGGTVSWFAGAADPRFAVVAPSCQTGTVYQHVRDRTVDGHCDCTFWINSLAWDLPDVAALIAPRPLLIAAATEDGLFRPYAFRQVYQRTRRLYHTCASEGRVQLVEALTPHGYSPKTRKAIFSFFNKYLKENAPTPLEDIDPDNVPDSELAVYPTRKPTDDDGLKQIDQTFIPAAEPAMPHPDTWPQTRRRGLDELRTLTFSQLPQIPLPAPPVKARTQGATKTLQFTTYEFESEPGLELRLNIAIPTHAEKPVPIVLAPMDPLARTPFACQGGHNTTVSPRQAGYACVEVRGTGTTAIGPGLEWTCRRAYAVVGQTWFERQILDYLAAAAVLRTLPAVNGVVAFGRGPSAVVSLYAAILDTQIDEVVLEKPVESHWNGGPELLNVLKVGDMPHNATLLWPRPITFVGEVPKAYQWTQKAYSRVTAPNACTSVQSLKEWKPAHKSPPSNT